MQVLRKYAAELVVYGQIQAEREKSRGLAKHVQGGHRFDVDYLFFLPSEVFG